MIEKAKKYAIDLHRNVNQKYGDYSYEYHLQMVVNIANDFSWMIPTKDLDDVIAGCWVHDVLEDVHSITYNNIKKELNETIAEYAFALTNEKGRSRKERANDKYYLGIKNYKHAAFIKLCDRIANVRFSKENNEKMFKMYKEEQDSFAEALCDGRFDGLWTMLKLLFE